MRLSSLFAIVAIALVPGIGLTQPVAAPTGVVAHVHASPSAQRIPPGAGLEADLRAASTYMGWGGLIGAAIGLAYGLSEARGTGGAPGIGVPVVMLDALAGGVIGGVLGATAYVVRRASGHARPAP